MLVQAPDRSIPRERRRGSRVGVVEEGVLRPRTTGFLAAHAPSPNSLLSRRVRGLVRQLKSQNRAVKRRLAFGHRRRDSKPSVHLNR